MSEFKVYTPGKPMADLQETGTLNEDLPKRWAECAAQRDAVRRKLRIALNSYMSVRHVSSSDCL